MEPYKGCSLLYEGDDLKKLKPLHYLFIVLNFLGIFLEYFLMHRYLFTGLFNLNVLGPYIRSRRQ